MFNQLADELKRQREQSGLTLKQLASKTRIDLKFLEAIEDGNFAFLPELYVKAFVKEYAKTVGLDDSVIIKKYEATKEGKEYDPNPPAVEITDNKIEKPNEEVHSRTLNQSVPKDEVKQQAVRYTSPIKSYVDEPKKKPTEDDAKANKQLMLFGLAGIGVIIIAALVYFIFLNHSNKIIVEETPIDEVVKQSSEQRYEEEKPLKENSDETESSVVNGDSLYLTFYAKESTWVFMVLDNNRTQEFTLNPNSKFVVAALQEFKGTVGNSGGIVMQLNNKDIEFAGRSGIVKHFKLDKNGLVYLNAPPKLEQ